MSMPSALNQWLMSLRVCRPVIVALAIAVVAGLAVLPGVQPSQAQGGAVAPQVEGSWLTIVSSPDVPAPFPTLITFGSGGVLTVTDSSFPPAAGNIYQGTWVRRRGNEIAFTFLGLQYDAASGALSGFIRVKETIRLDTSGNSYSSVISTLEFLDVNQNVVVGPLQATTHGTRINAE